MKWRWLPLSTRNAEAFDLSTARSTTLPLGVVDLDALARHHGPVAVLEIADGVGERRERDRVGAEIHLAVAVADRERRALAGADQQILLAGEQEGQRERAAQPRQRRLDRLDRRLALLHLVGDEMRDHLGVGLAAELRAASSRALRAARGNSR